MKRVLVMTMVVALVIAVGVTLEAASSLVTHSPERSGPVSTFPASWVSVCGITRSGDETTGIYLGDNGSKFDDHLNLKFIYNQMTTSSAFKQLSQGDGWVVSDWLYNQGSGSNGTSTFYNYDLMSTFVLIGSSGSPAGYINAEDNLQTGTFTFEFVESLVANCPSA